MRFEDLRLVVPAVAVVVIVVLVPKKELSPQYQHPRTHDLSRMILTIKNYAL